jgi:hypothetical protein
MTNQKNVLGEPLKPCCFDPQTGFYRDGYCNTGPEDYGSHTVCVEVTEDFLNFSKAKGNDLSTPHPEFGFPGLKSGDRWCLCAKRWQEAYLAGFAPSVLLTSTHERCLEEIKLEDLKKFAIDLS